MTRVNFIGRTRELELLRGISLKKRSVITAIYGRRRVGKTTLVEHAFEDQFFLKFEGLEDRPDQEQRDHFIQTLASYSGRPEYRLIDTSHWTNLLIALSEFISNRPCVVLLDEYQWLSAEKTELTSHLKYCWDNFLQKNNCVHLIICGSVSSFIVKKVIKSKALYGRIDTFINLKPLNLRQSVVDFFSNETNHRQYLDYYLAVGGVPKYLELYNTNLSFEQNMESLCFQPSGYLYSEIERLFVSHFGKKSIYRDLTCRIAREAHCTQSVLGKKLHIPSGGRLSEYLDELELAGFIDTYQPLHSPGSKRLLRYRIRDYYLRFYFRFIEPNLKYIDDSSPADSRYSRFIKEQQANVWRGLAFEQCCRDNHFLIAKILGFSGVNYLSGSWFKRSDQQAGTQIDLLFMRADGVMTLCEVKYQRNLTSDLFTHIERKVDRIIAEANPDAVQRVLVSVYPPSPELTRKGRIDVVITLEDLLNVKE